MSAYSSANSHQPVILPLRGNKKRLKILNNFLSSTFNSDCSLNIRTIDYRFLIVLSYMIKIQHNDLLPRLCSSVGILFFSQYQPTLACQLLFVSFPLLFFSWWGEFGSLINIDQRGQQCVSVEEEALGGRYRGSFGLIIFILIQGLFNLGGAHNILEFRMLNSFQPDQTNLGGKSWVNILNVPLVRTQIKPDLCFWSRQQISHSVDVELTGSYGPGLMCTKAYQWENVLV